MTEVDEKNEFARLMGEAGVKHQVRLASGARGRGLFPTGPTGWSQSDVLLSVPLDVCIATPFGDEDGIKAEFAFAADGSKDTLTVLRRAWEARNGVKVPTAITNLLRSPSGDDRELAIVLWLVWATKSGGDLWRAYGEWLPQPESMPSLLLASEKELAQLQDEELASEARALQVRIAVAYDRLPAINAEAKEMKGAPVPVRKHASSRLIHRHVSFPFPTLSPSCTHSRNLTHELPAWDVSVSLPAGHDAGGSGVGVCARGVARRGD